MQASNPHALSRTVTHGASAHTFPQHRTPATVAPSVRPKLIRMPEVQAVCGLGKSMIYALIAKGEFPASVKCGPRVVAWIEAEVDAWIAARISAAKGGAA